MDYKEKYDAALGIAKMWHKNTAVPKECKVIFEQMFPELKESYGEKIRKELIEHIKANYEADYVLFKKFPPDDVIAWLEKQGEQKSAVIIPKFRVGDEIKTSNGESLTITKIDEKGYWSEDLFICGFGDSVKWELVDNVEPKFHPGEWIIFNEKHNSAYQVERIDNYRYCLRHYLGGTLSVPFDSELIRLWTIEDAQDGDILDANGAPFIYKKHDKDYVYFYCGVNLAGEFIEATEFDTWNNNYKVYPATNEQRDLLFHKMDEAGYEWDGEKKELNKLEKRKIS